MSVRKLSRSQLRAMGYRHGRKNRPLMIHPKHTSKAFQKGHMAGFAAFRAEAISKRYARL